jgi:hypothetical protein
MSLNLDDNKRPYSPNLGLNEVFDEIQASVNALETTVNNIPTGYTEAIINVSSAQILAMGSSPIEILPAPGAGKYYDIDGYIIEYTHVSTPYTLGTVTAVALVSSDTLRYIFIDASILTETINTYTRVSDDNFWTIYPNGGSPASNRINLGYTGVNTGVNLYTLNNSNTPVNPTLGNGTMRIKVYYKEITFGA